MIQEFYISRQLPVVKKQKLMQTCNTSEQFLIISPMAAETKRNMVENCSLVKTNLALRERATARCLTETEHSSKSTKMCEV